MRRYVGIDPGVTGAFAVLDLADDGQQTLSVHPTPCDWIQVGTGKRRRYSLYAVERAFTVEIARQPITFAYLEAQSARPKQGVASMFYLGFGLGMWQTLLTAKLVPFALVPAPRWRVLAGLPPAPKLTPKQRKEQVRLAACRRFPGVAIPLDHADAVMMAVAASTEHQNGSR